MPRGLPLERPPPCRAVMQVQPPDEPEPLPLAGLPLTGLPQRLGVARHGARRGARRRLWRAAATAAPTQGGPAGLGRGARVSGEGVRARARVARRRG